MNQITGFGQNIIEINGKKYDAATGKLLKDSSSAVKKTPIVKNRGSIDGFAR